MDTIKANKSYPGDLASPFDMWRLANEYRAAAHSLIQSGQRRRPLSWAPYRLSAIHAIELYLNAMLLDGGCSPGELRALQHRFSDRIALAEAAGLVLRKRTAAHLVAMDGNREYVVTRYGPEMTATMSQTNRLMATLEELADKVTARLAPSEAQASASPSLAPVSAA